MVSTRNQGIFSWIWKNNFRISISGYDKNAELLIKNGANVNLANKNGATPIDIAAFNGKKPIECFNTENQRNSAELFILSSLP